MGRSVTARRHDRAQSHYRVGVARTGISMVTQRAIGCFYSETVGDTVQRTDTELMAHPTPTIPSIVTVELADGPLGGRAVTAPRDELGRVLAVIEVGLSDGRPVVFRQASAAVAAGAARYQFESWMDTNPLYRHVA